MDLLKIAAHLQQQSILSEADEEYVVLTEGEHGESAIYLTKMPGGQRVVGVRLQEDHTNPMAFANRALSVGFSARYKAESPFALIDEAGLWRCCRKIDMAAITAHELGASLDALLVEANRTLVSSDQGSTTVWPADAFRANVDLARSASAPMTRDSGWPSSSDIGDPIGYHVNDDTLSGDLTCDLKLFDLNGLSHDATLLFCRAALRINFFTLFDGSIPIRLDSNKILGLSGVHIARSGTYPQGWLTDLQSQANRLTQLFSALASAAGASSCKLKNRPAA